MMYTPLHLLELFHHIPSFSSGLQSLFGYNFWESYRLSLVSSFFDIAAIKFPVCFFFFLAFSFWVNESWSLVLFLCGSGWLGVCFPQLGFFNLFFKNQIHLHVFLGNPMFLLNLFHSSLLYCCFLFTIFPAVKTTF